MSLKTLLSAVALAFGTLLGTGTAEAAGSSTTINVVGMHCVSCARKVTGHLQAVSETGPVTVDVETGKVIVPSRSQVVPSPRSLWEAVERAGYKPVQLISPMGTFSEKPKL
ncbi:MAG: heavy-metal-associated domain-containing protein [Planctomycetes bacterium]|nr:heavy-metal-associated domain-containing protein [Planctomycetota bacterium]